MNEILYEILIVLGAIGLSGVVVFLFVIEPRLHK
jgi:hypothetical protein